MHTVLISAVGGDIGQGILKSLRSVRPRVRIIGCDMTPNSPGPFLFDKGYIVAAAKNDEKKYIKYLNIVLSLLKRSSITLLLLKYYFL